MSERSKIGGLKSAFEPSATSPKSSSVSGLASRFESASTSPTEGSGVAGKIGALAGAFGAVRGDEKKSPEAWQKAVKADSKEEPVRVREVLGGDKAGEMATGSPMGVGGVAAMFEKGVSGGSGDKETEKVEKSAGVGEVKGMFENARMKESAKETPNAFAEAAKKFGS